MYLTEVFISKNNNFIGGYSTDQDSFIDHVWYLDGNLVVELSNLRCIGAFLFVVGEIYKTVWEVDVKSKCIMRFPKKVLLPGETAILTDKHKAVECCFNNQIHVEDKN